MKQFYALQHTETGEKLKVVQGRKVTIPGFEEFNFFTYEGGGRVHIVEVRTGMATSGLVNKTLKEAKERTLHNLTRVGKADFAVLLEKQIIKRAKEVTQ